MKKNLLLLTAFIASFWVSGQNIFERYADNDEVTLVSISPKMFKMFAMCIFKSIVLCQSVINENNFSKSLGARTLQ